MISDEAAAELRAAVERRLAERIEQARQRRENRRAVAAAKAARRAAGLRARHALIVARREPDRDQ